ncbi:MAG: UDP-N-acetylmuramoyl-L-alanyl-D-glutamate--2,6-diaminopimelate ligase [Pyrinomonadaceae bacterium]|nr:UDP-N-acetylmuramoyl-L-alanyl-D-glutamate--2,6-diaminopimelate ligase [Pyrinomonadaceae bacterium]
MAANHITAAELAENMNLTQLFGNGELEIKDITHDSRQARPGSLFVAVKGLTMDGHKFIEDVIRRGAAGIISQQDPTDGFQGIWLKVPDSRKAMAEAAAIVHGNPSAELNLIGITGTNGKTTTTYLTLAVANAGGSKSAMLTTVEYRIGEETRPAVRTTPESTDTQRFLREAVSKGCRTAVMEASSQAIDLRRCDKLEFRVAVFTNLTRDHLDYHHTMENYFDAKKELFDGRLGKPPAASVINIDDEWGVKLADDLRECGQKVVTCSQVDDADLKASNIEVSLVTGTEFDLETGKGSIHIQSPLVGKPHVYNMLSAAAVGLELDLELSDIAKAFENCIGAPGRFEKVPHDGDFAIVVDYAHSDDALLNTLKTARELAKGRIITVFGCGGDRDKTKRIPMGEVAGMHSDFVIVTSDNPRTEDPLAIINEIESGIKSTGCDYAIEPDRREAIFKAVATANTNDVVIVAGKGHETYQIVGGDKFHFDDREIAAEAIESLEL